MTARKSAAARDPTKPGEKRASDFPRPDAEQGKHGAPTHERAPERSPDDANPPLEESPRGNGHTHTDQQIRAQIEQRLRRESALRARHLIVSVGTGVVTLRGEVDDELERTRLVELVRQVPAVRELRDELITRSASN